MKLFSTATCLLLCGCAATHSPPAPRAVIAKPAADHDERTLLDTVIRDWLLHSRDHSNKFVVLLTFNLPSGYKLSVEGWTILPAAEIDPLNPPTTVRGDTVQYHFNYHSSYVTQEKLAPTTIHRLKPGESPPPPHCILPIVEIDNPTVLCIDAVLLKGDSAEVRISQNRHHNLGGSGTTYHCTRVNNVWNCHSDEGWMN